MLFIVKPAAGYCIENAPEGRIVPMLQVSVRHNFRATVNESQVSETGAGGQNCEHWKSNMEKPQVEAAL